MELAKDTLDRIFAAADTLFEQDGHVGFPTVDAVRKTARVNMNDASTGMKAWRRARVAQTVVTDAPTPESVQRAGATALAVLWRDAQELANESLRAARAAWEVERAEANLLNKQMADAFEAQATELRAASDEAARLGADAEQLTVENLRLHGALSDARRELAAVRAEIENTEARRVEIERRAVDLRTELDYAHQEGAQARLDREGMRMDHVAELAALRREFAHAQSKCETERDNALSEAQSAREGAAALRAQVDALKEQYAALMQLASRPPAKALRRPGGQEK